MYAFLPPIQTPTVSSERERGREGERESVRETEEGREEPTEIMENRKNAERLEGDRVKGQVEPNYRYFFSGMLEKWIVSLGPSSNA